eukprot:CAMPEP_0113912322 /NCGR_PEP_ID=MMETSP0780_2-20120614/28863_1 /TAXON_ID=652834 /ORGANISM="Palpitomonas bilix" /LENGTH=335 /DNA_ID=CAMNT_0000909269 /DNA_START=117 /DNA_END=1124 /DNA_ORIENTATION=- /assembly_acc=CAM_ASM_000599
MAWNSELKFNGVDSEGVTKDLSSSFEHTPERACHSPGIYGTSPPQRLFCSPCGSGSSWHEGHELYESSWCSSSIFGLNTEQTNTENDRFVFETTEQRGSKRSIFDIHSTLDDIDTTAEKKRKQAEDDFKEIFNNPFSSTFGSETEKTVACEGALLFSVDEFSFVEERRCDECVDEFRPSPYLSNDFATLQSEFALPRSTEEGRSEHQDSSNQALPKDTILFPLTFEPLVEVPATPNTGSEPSTSPSRKGLIVRDMMERVKRIESIASVGETAVLPEGVLSKTTIAQACKFVGVSYKTYNRYTNTIKKAKKVDPSLLQADELSYKELCERLRSQLA